MIRKVAGRSDAPPGDIAPREADAGSGNDGQTLPPRVPLYYGQVPAGAKLPARTVRIAFGNTQRAVPRLLIYL